MKIYQSVVGLCLASLLSACGGGGGSTPAVVTGIFVDSYVIGINYATATQSGKTKANGEFSYVAGETITYSIGSIQLPAVRANATITPLDIANTTDSNNQVVSNILVLLQSLDEDGNPANGISIPAAAAAKATNAINFDVSPSVFAANPAVTELVANSGSVTKTLVTVDAATAHFDNTLNGIGGTTKINVAPMANAGTTQSLMTGAVVTLGGSASSDANNDTLTYLWTLTTKPSGSTATLTAPATVKPTFTADVAGSYVASLVVNDGKLDSTASTVTVTASVANAAPIANAGTAQSVLRASTVTLNGAASSDANGDDALTYAWTLTSKPTSSTATLASATSVAPTFTADLAGSYVATLVVNDGQVNSTGSTITVTASVANAAPVANASIAQKVVTGALVTLSGSASSDANSDPLTYRWTLTSKPTSSTATLASATSVAPTFTADRAGSYVATLVVNDGKVNSAGSTITVTANAPVVAWGSNSFGQTTIPAGLSGVTAIAAGGYHTVALKNDGTVVAWGENSTGATTIPAGLSGVTAIAAGDSHTVALKNDGTVVAWGVNYNDYGQTTIPAGLSGVTAIAAGGYHTVALKSDGTVVAWGDTRNGGTTIPAGLSGVTAIAAGSSYTVALKNDGTVVAWGNNQYGQTTIPAGLSGVTAIAARGVHTVALKNDGTVVVWGSNEYGERTIPAGLSGVTAIAAGYWHTVALKNDGTVVAWGYNGNGERTIPAGLSGVVAIAAGDHHTVALVPLGQ